MVFCLCIALLGKMRTTTFSARCCFLALEAITAHAAAADKRQNKLKLPALLVELGGANCRASCEMITCRCPRADSSTPFRLVVPEVCGATKATDAHKDRTNRLSTQAFHAMVEDLHLLELS